MSDLEPDPKPLPLRIPPVEGECWRSYLNRVAHEYRCRDQDLVSAVSQRWAARLTRWPSTACSGIAMTVPVAKAIAQRLNLTPEEVQAMQLSVHDGLTITLGSEAASERFDPVFGTNRLGHFASLGWLAAFGTSRRCPQCVGTAVVPLIWHYPWVTVCRRHGQLLERAQEIGPPELSENVVTRLLNVQVELEAIVSGTSTFDRLTPREGFREIRAVVETLNPHPGERRVPDLWRAEHLTEALPLALEAVQGRPDVWSDAIDYLLGNQTMSISLVRQLQRHGASNPFGLRSDLAARHVGNPAHALIGPGSQIRVPADHCLLMTRSQRRQAKAAFPTLLPRASVVPTLTDYTPWLTTADATLAATQTAYMMVTAGTLHQAIQDRPSWATQHRPLRRTWWHLESTGQLDEYFDAVRAALRTLLRTSTELSTYDTEFARTS